MPLRMSLFTGLECGHVFRSTDMPVVLLSDCERHHPARAHGVVVVFDSVRPTQLAHSLQVPQASKSN